MKKLLLIAAALTTMVSCSKTQVIPEETAQQEIAIKAYNQTAVKATGPISGTSFSEAYNTELMRVYGFYSSDASTYAPYFTADYKYQTANSVTAWMGWDGTAHKPYYWPSTGNMKFIAVFPIDYPVISSSTGSITSSISGSVITTDIKNVDLTTIASQKDIMYSSLTETCPNTTSSSSALVFQHLLSQVILNIVPNANSDITIYRVVLNDANLKGDIKIVDDGTTTHTITYPNCSDGNLDILVNNEGEKVLSSASSNTVITTTGVLVFPTNDPQLTVEYSIGDNTTHITNTIELTQWSAGMKYIYDLSFNLNEIKFTASVTPWDDETVTPSI